MTRRKIVESDVDMPEKTYVIPTKKEYMKHRIDRGRSWEDTYLHWPCYVCREHFEVGDIYVSDGNIRKRKSWKPLFRHATCDPANPPKRTRKSKAIEHFDEDDDGTKRVYSDNKTPVGENVIFGSTMYLVIERGTDDEGDYLELEEVEEDEDVSP